MADPNIASDHSLWSLIIGKILDWPVLLFILILILLRKSGPTMLELFKSRKVEVELGGNKLSIGDAVEALDDETKQALDDFRKHQQEINSLKQQVEAIEKAISSEKSFEALSKGKTFVGVLPPTEFRAGIDVPGAATDGEPQAAGHNGPQTEASKREVAFKRMIAALSSSQFRWRSIERLAIEAGVTEREAHKILAEHHGEVVLGKGKSGRTIARLPER